MYVGREAQLVRTCGERGDFADALRLLEKAQAILSEYVDANRPKLRDKALERLQNNRTAPAALTLEHAIEYVYREAQLARSENEYEDFKITLRMLELLRDWSSELSPFDVACGYAVGKTGSRYLNARAARGTFLHQQFVRLIPDYDWSNEKPPEDDPTDGRRLFYGNRFTGRLCDMDTSPVSPDDPTTTSEPPTNYAAASWAMGDRPNAEGKYPDPSIMCATGHPGIPNAYRRGAPKSIRSDAQRRSWCNFKYRETRGAVAGYFGA